MAIENRLLVLLKRALIVGAMVSLPWVGFAALNSAETNCPPPGLTINPSSPNYGYGSTVWRPGYDKPWTVITNFKIPAPPDNLVYFKVLPAFVGTPLGLCAYHAGIAGTVTLQPPQTLIK